MALSSPKTEPLLQPREEFPVAAEPARHVVPIALIDLFPIGQQHTKENTMRPFTYLYVLLACTALVLGQFGCGTTGSLLSSTQFSASAYNTDKQLKADSLAFIDRAKNKAPYDSVAEDVNGLMNKIDATIATEQQRTKNVPTVAQWKKIKARLTSFFELWKTKRTLSPAFVDDARTEVSGLFDILINTENDKRARS